MGQIETKTSSFILNPLLSRFGQELNNKTRFQYLSKKRDQVSVFNPEFQSKTELPFKDKKVKTVQLTRFCWCKARTNCFTS